MGAPVLAPDEGEFLAAFGVSPIEARPRDGFWRYRFEDGNGLTVDFSFCTHDTSVQTTTSFHGREADVVSHECASEIRIRENGGKFWIYVTFEPTVTVTRLVVGVLPEPKVTWSTIRA